MIVTAIGYALTEDNTAVSESGSTYVNPTGWEITGASLDANSDYILIYAGHLGGSSNSSNECRCKIYNGISTITGADGRIEPRGSGEQYGNHWGFLKKLTTSASPGDIEWRFRNNGGSVSTYSHACHMLMLKLDDITENTDWFYAEDETADDNLSTSAWTDRDSVTIGDGSSTYLIFGHAGFESDNTNDDIRICIDVGGVEYAECRMEVEDANEEHSCLVITVASAPSASTVAKVKVRSTDGGTPDCIHSSIFALRLDVFEDWFASIDSSMSETQFTATETDYVVSTKTHTVDTAASRNWIIGASTRFNVQGDAVKTPQMKITDSGISFTVGLTGNWDASPTGAGLYNNGGSDIPTWNRFGEASSVADATNLDIDVVCRDSFDVSPNYGARTVTWFGFTTELAAAGGGEQSGSLLSVGVGY